MKSGSRFAETARVRKDYGNLEYQEIGPFFYTVSAAAETRWSAWFKQLYFSGAILWKQNVLFCRKAARAIIMNWKSVWMRRWQNGMLRI